MLIQIVVFGYAMSLTTGKLEQEDEAALDIVSCSTPMQVYSSDVPPEEVGFYQPATSSVRPRGPAG